MAAADLLTCLTRIALLSSFMANDDTSVGRIACRWSETPFAICDVSLIMLIAMSFDRYRKITKPLCKQIDRKIGTILCVFFYILAVCAHLQFFFEGAFIFYPETRICAENISGAENTMLSIIAIIVIAGTTPIILILCFNFKTLRYLKTVKLFEENGNNAGNGRMTRLEYKRNLTAAKTLRMFMILAVVTNFVPRVLATIGFVVFTTNSASALMNEAWLSILYQTSCDLIFASCAINFFVYLKFLKEFRAFVSNRGRNGMSFRSSSTITHSMNRRSTTSN